MRSVISFLKDESGASAAEYALILGVIAAAIVAAVTTSWQRYFYEHHQQRGQNTHRLIVRRCWTDDLPTLHYEDQLERKPNNQINGVNQCVALILF